MAGLDRELFIAMFKEEWRLHKSFVGSIGSGFFPFMIFLFSMVLAMTAPVVLSNIDIPTVLLILHAAAFLYGLSVGALGHIGEQVMTRRLGQVNLLLQLSHLYPVSFKRLMAIFYVKDAVYYILYSIIPLVLGIMTAVPVTDITFGAVALLGVTIFITFMLGMSLTFCLSALSLRSKAAAGGMILFLLVLVLLTWPLGIIAPTQLIPTLGFWKALDPLPLLLTSIIVLLLSVIAVLATKERFEAPQDPYENRLMALEKMFGFTGSMRTLVAKEWLELRRSGTLGAVFTGFLGPLFGIYLLVWILEKGIGFPLDLNLVFFGGMVGFLGTMTYSWITNLEPNEFLNVQPMTVSRVIKAKLILYFLLTLGTAIGYVVVIGIMNDELELLPQALMVVISTTIYVAAVTSWLTGLWTNTMLFDVKVLAKFFVGVVPPLVGVMMVSFVMDRYWAIGFGLLALLSFGMLVVARYLFRDIDDKWKDMPFSFATTGPGSS